MSLDEELLSSKHVAVLDCLELLLFLSFCALFVTMINPAQEFRQGWWLFFKEIFRGLLVVWGGFLVLIHAAEVGSVVA